MQEVYHILFIILPNYSAVVDVYVLNFLGVYGFRGLVQQWAVKEFYYCCTVVLSLDLLQQITAYKFTTEYDSQIQETSWFCFCRCSCYLSCMQGM